LKFKCYLCENTKTNKQKYRHLEFKGEILQCNNCELIQLHPLPDENDIKLFYSEKYRIKRTDTSLHKEYIQSLQKHAAQQFDFIQSHISIQKSWKIMELGTSAGYLLKKFHQNGNTIIGFEPDKIMATNAKSQGLLIYNEVFNPDLIQEKVDIILLSHVFEHLIDPLDLMKSFEKILKPGGYIFIEIPNDDIESIEIYTSIDRSTYAHTFFFNSITFTNLINHSKNYNIEIINSAGMTKINWLQERRTNIIIKGVKKIWKIFNKKSKTENIYIKGMIPNNYENLNKGVALRILLQYQI